MQSDVQNKAPNYYNTHEIFFIYLYESTETFTFFTVCI